MTRAIAAFCALLLLPACDVDRLLTNDEVRDPANICPTGVDSQCAFFNAPVRVRDAPQKIAGRSYRFFPMASELTFVDGTARQWVAPAGTLTDGASIPPIFVSIVGNPTAPELQGAAAVHDAYCGIGNESGPNYHAAEWPDVHRMFYDALIAGGTEATRAKIMFAAVYLGGPRWTRLRDDTDPSRNLDAVSLPRRQRAMREAKSFIEREDPDMPRLESYLLWLERRMLQELVEVPERAGAEVEPEEPAIEEPIGEAG